MYMDFNRTMADIDTINQTAAIIAELENQFAEMRIKYFDISDEVDDDQVFTCYAVKSEYMPPLTESTPDVAKLYMDNKRFILIEGNGINIAVGSQEPMFLPYKKRYYTNPADPKELQEEQEELQKHRLLDDWVSPMTRCVFDRNSNKVMIIPISNTMLREITLTAKEIRQINYHVNMYALKIFELRNNYAKAVDDLKMALGADED